MLSTPFVSVSSDGDVLVIQDHSLSSAVLFFPSQDASSWLQTGLMPQPWPIRSPIAVSFITLMLQIGASFRRFAPYQPPGAVFTDLCIRFQLPNGLTVAYVDCDQLFATAHEWFVRHCYDLVVTPRRHETTSGPGSQLTLLHLLSATNEIASAIGDSSISSECAIPPRSLLQALRRAHIRMRDDIDSRRLPR